MNPTPRKNDDETQKAIDEWIAKGNEVKQLPYGARTEDLEVKGGFYGRKKKKTEK